MYFCPVPDGFVLVGGGAEEGAGAAAAGRCGRDRAVWAQLGETTQPTLPRPRQGVTGRAGAEGGAEGGAGCREVEQQQQQ